MLELKMTRFFTCEGVNLAYAVTVNAKDLELGTKAVTQFLAAEVSTLELPPMGDEAWREMTDDEAREYQKDQEQEQRATRLSRDSFEDEDEF